MSNELVPFDADVLGLITSSFDNRGLPMPFVREIFLLETKVAGTSHVDEIEKIAQNLEIREFVVMKREPENPHDELAILILNENGRKVGYVPREKNEVIARLMDAGKFIFGRVEYKKWTGYYLYVKIRIFLREM